MSKMNKSKTKAVMLTADMFEDMEVFFPYFRLLEEGIHGENGYLLMPDKAINEVD